MQQESKDIVIKNFVTLMKDCNVDVLKEMLVKKEVFSAKEINDMFSSPDARHNKRLFFFNIQKKEQRAFNILIDCLRATYQHNIVELLVPAVSGCKQFRSPQESGSLTYSYYVNSTTASLDVRVIPSDQFYDTQAHNKAVHYYSTRSKKRGKLLIINNYEYNGHSEYRAGAIVDNSNLHKLFYQMGGWDVQHHNNKTAEEMSSKINQFAQDEHGTEYDICFVIIMGHGNELRNETIIYGTDNSYIFANDIQKEFTNERCKSFRGKPKVFIFQVCRGDILDHTIRHAETDSVFREPAKSISASSHNRITTNVRTEEDMLIGYATLHGYKAHRDPFRGSWYIELISEKFMNFAHDHSVEDLLRLVDQGLRTRMSDAETMQTSEHRNKGFNKLYLHPGIYYENEEIKQFNTI